MGQTFSKGPSIPITHENRLNVHEIDANLAWYIKKTSHFVLWFTLLKFNNNNGAVIAFQVVFMVYT